MAPPRIGHVGAVDFCIIGGGIVGLTIARELRRREPTASIMVLEKEARLGEHASGRNSGVLHAGFYYAPDSLKARLTARGNRLLREFCDEAGVPVRSCGKVVVAQRPEDLPRLDELARRGRLNGVELEVIDEAALRDLEPMARTIDKAIWSPTTGVADPFEVLSALLRNLRENGVEVRTSSPVLSAGPGRVVTADEVITTHHVVNAAGLYADHVAGWFGFCDDYVVMPFKGLYWYGNEQAPTFRRHIYPVPDPRNPFLGVHFTVTPGGGVKVGPTAIPVLWREAYSGLSRIEGDEVREVARNFPRFLKSRHHNVPSLIRAEVPKYSRRYLIGKAKALAPSVVPGQFTVKGRPGIRAQLLHKATGQLEMDFLVRGDSRSTHVLNAVSPAWTSSMAFAEHVLDGMASRHVV